MTLTFSDFLLGGDPPSFNLDQVGSDAGSPDGMQMANGSDKRSRTASSHSTGMPSRGQTSPHIGHRDGRASPLAALESSIDAQISAAALGEDDEWPEEHDTSQEEMGEDEMVNEATSKRRMLSEQIENMDCAVEKWQQQEIAWSSKLRYHAQSLSHLRRHMHDSAEQRAGHLRGGSRNVEQGSRKAARGLEARRGADRADERGMRDRAPLKGCPAGGAARAGTKKAGEEEARHTHTAEPAQNELWSCSSAQLSCDSDDLVRELYHYNYYYY